MVDQKRERSFYEKNGVPAPAKKIYFYNGELYRIISRVPQVDLINLYHFHSGQIQVCSLTDFQRRKKRAWNNYQTRKFFNRSLKTWEKYLARRIIPRPVYAGLNNTPGSGIRSYYSEEHIHNIRDAIAEIPFGAPPRDGRVRHRTKVLTKQELRARLGDGQMLYIKDPHDDNKFIPVWSESI